MGLFSNVNLSLTLISSIVFILKHATVDKNQSKLIPTPVTCRDSGGL